MQIYKITWIARSGSIKEYEEFFCIANNALEAFLSIHPNSAELTLDDAISLARKLAGLNTLVVDGEFYDEILDKGGNWIYFDALVESTNTSDPYEVAGKWEGTFSRKDLKEFTKKEIVSKLFPAFSIYTWTSEARELAEKALEIVLNEES